MKLTYLAAILALTFGVPLSLQPVFEDMAITSSQCMDEGGFNSPAECENMSA